MEKRSVYDSIREGIADDWRKAQAYDGIVERHKIELAKAKENPNQDVWRNGYDAGFEAARRLYRGEYPLNEQEQWESFKASRTPPQPKETDNG